MGNVDCTISMQRPKLRPHIDRMRETIARTIGIDTDAVSVKATTTERLGFEAVSYTHLDVYKRQRSDASTVS